ncbi:MAG: prolyl oligopeptidase family serine peptidase [FCB group bacterium]|nr:prolyl oligopeptidase family serine peptidase [FCB group bacterium]MBL7028618.1 prolyl oligopeptidase family serine peptidase [Candidatus Neomarinimicrobiota bacterium]MBL7121808.1 prolyl oligopeptidase family serine peptidase [Candidatus Neomarinimicrobiota bacterium]
MMKNRYTLTLLSILLLLISCEKEQNNEPEINICNPAGVPGTLIQSELKITITPAQVQAALSAYLPINYELDYSTDVYSITYNTRDKNGDIIIVSGTMFIPVGLDSLDVLSTQHGTTLKRTDVGSVNFYYAIDGLLMAMKGYLVIAPDYIGLGQSELLHPYLHAQLSANPVIDMIRAAKAYACENEMTLSDRLFLSGYSEGGYVTMAAHKNIETDYSDEFNVTAVAPMSGPYDLLGSTRNLLSRDTYDIPAFLAYVVVAYDDIYGWNRLSDIFHEPYASMLPGLYDGTWALGDVNDTLTTTIDSLFKTDFTTAFFAGREVAIQTALEENTLLDWGPVAPVRLYHGTADSTVSIENTLSAYASLQANGGLSVDLVTLPGADHISGFFLSMILAEAWFDSIRTASQ